MKTATNTFKKFALAGLAAALMASAAPPAHAWDPVRDLTGKTLKQHVEKKIDTTLNSAEKFVKDPAGYIASRPERLFSEVCAAPIRNYENLLEGRARGRWKALPAPLVNALQSEYSSVNLAGVRYAEGMPTSNGAAQTIGSNIYFPRGVNLLNRGDLHWMLHELEHTQQFGGARGGTNGKLCEYVAKAVGSGFSHDDIDMERAAERKANYLINYAFDVMTKGGNSFGGQRLTANQIHFQNKTIHTIVFYIESAANGQEEVVLGPGQGKIFTDDPSVTSFSFGIWTNGQLVSYGLDGGTYQEIAFNSFGLLDAFRL